MQYLLIKIQVEWFYLFLSPDKSAFAQWTNRLRNLHYTYIGSWKKSVKNINLEIFSGVLVEIDIIFQIEIDCHSSFNEWKCNYLIFFQVIAFLCGYFHHNAPSPPLPNFQSWNVGMWGNFSFEKIFISLLGSSAIDKTLK